MNVKKIVNDYLKQNGFDGLHSHPENNDYAGCGCSINNSCDEFCGLCEPAYKHSLYDCPKCPDYTNCEPWAAETDSPNYMIVYCGKKKE